jgi:hypothetical protein
LKKKLFVFFLFCVFSFRGNAQIEKGTTQLGIGVLPIYDVFNLFPEAELSGLAVSANFGYLAIKRMSVGMNPYYAQISNTYKYSSYNTIRTDEERAKIYGLNVYLRYSVISKNKFLVYPSLSCCFCV